MKIILLQSLPYFPTKGGGDKSNKMLIEELIKRGHECHVIAVAANLDSDIAFEKYPSILEEHGITEIEKGDDCIRFNLNGIVIHAIKQVNKIPPYFIKIFKEIDPDWVFVPTEDFAQMLLETAVNVDASKVIYLARTTIRLPFGPDSSLVLPQKTHLFRKVRGIMAVSQFMKEYIYTWTGVQANVLPISLHGTVPLSNFGNFDDGFVTLINPCIYKGISIFLDLAKKFPDTRFAAVPTWGATETDMINMKKQKNVTILNQVDDIDIVYKQTKILLVPSLWAEAKSRCIGEALLRGIPVLASDTGGNKEAMPGLDYLLQVNKIVKYNDELDSRRMHTAEVPVQNMQPWYEALNKLLTDRNHYNELSARSREIAYKVMIENNNVDRVEEYLLKLKSEPVNNSFNSSDFKETGEEDNKSKLLKSLTHEQKLALLSKLKK
jgi:glycosyltransferase involved in cell wall biosynthesis